MNCSPCIAIALLLIALTAGAFLLYKAKKESLGILHRLIGWFVIIVAIGCIVCCGMRCMRKCCMRGGECGMEQKCEMRMMGGGMHGGKCCMMKERSCCEGEEGACGHEEKSCCKGDEEHCEKKVEIKVDTVVNKH